VINKEVHVRAVVFDIPRDYLGIGGFEHQFFHSDLLELGGSGRAAFATRSRDVEIPAALVSSVEEAAECIVRLLKDEKLRAEMGQKARETVREKFLLTRYLEQYFDFFASQLNRRRY
jgi:glycosyltransferase involved in cell wall biosynthesis